METKLTSEQAAYIAGFVDGEGSITVALVKQTTKNPRWFAQVTISQVDPRPLAWIKGLVGGTMYLYAPKGAISKRPIWRYCLSNTRLTGVLRQIIPYMKVKREKAESALQLREMVERNGKKKLSSSERESRLRLVVDFKNGTRSTA